MKVLTPLPDSEGFTFEPPTQFSSQLIETLTAAMMGTPSPWHMPTLHGRRLSSAGPLYADLDLTFDGYACTATMTLADAFGTRTQARTGREVLTGYEQPLLFDWQALNVVYRACHTAHYDVLHVYNSIKKYREFTVHGPRGSNGTLLLPYGASCATPPPAVSPHWGFVNTDYEIPTEVQREFMAVAYNMISKSLKRRHRRSRRLSGWFLRQV